jgi:hypothetical protein
MLHRAHRLCVSRGQIPAYYLIPNDRFFSIGFIKTDNFQIWQSFFWICGAMTITYGLVVGIFLPDNPVKAKFINQREKAIAIDRVRVNQTGAFLLATTIL